MARPRKQRERRRSSPLCSTLFVARRDRACLHRSRFLSCSFHSFDRVCSSDILLSVFWCSFFFSEQEKFAVMAGEGPAIGIDLGTTYSCVGVWQHDRVEIIANDQGNRTTPSYVAFTDTERLIGDAAKNQVAMNPTNTVFGTSPLLHDS